MSLHAITFDLWDTIIIDGSDELKRQSRGLLPKPMERRNLFWQALDRHAPIDKAITDAAFNVQEYAFYRTWYQMFVTWEVSDRLEILLKGLDRKLPEPEQSDLIEQIEGMELTVKPDLIPGAAEAIEELAARYDLCVISDTIYTPGKYLRELLQYHGIAHYFKGFVFSDEVGRSKPHPACFAQAAEQLGTDYSQMLHVGDRDEKDIIGAHQVGMKAILFTAARDEGTSASTKAEAVVDNYSDLIGAINLLSET